MLLPLPVNTDMEGGGICARIGVTYLIAFEVYTRFLLPTPHPFIDDYSRLCLPYKQPPKTLKFKPLVTHAQEPSSTSSKSKSASTKRSTSTPIGTEVVAKSVLTHKTPTTTAAVDGSISGRTCAGSDKDGGMRSTATAEGALKPCPTSVSLGEGYGNRNTGEVCFQNLQVCTGSCNIDGALF